MDNLTSDLLKTALGALGGTALGYVVWIRQKAREMRAGHDAELRQVRMRAYVRLWKNLEVLALYSPRASGVQFRDITALGGTLREWYFARGGLLMTESSRDGYFLLQHAIEHLRAQKVDPRLWLRRAGTPSVGRSADGGDSFEAFRARELHLPLLPPVTGGGRRALGVWKGKVEGLLRNYKFGVPDAGGECVKDFVLLQFLASALRTLLVADLNSRDPSLLSR